MPVLLMHVVRKSWYRGDKIILFILTMVRLFFFNMIHVRIICDTIKCKCKVAPVLN